MGRVRGHLGGRVRAVVAFAISLVILAVAASSASADFRDVSPNGSDAGNDCSDQNAPCRTIQHAIDEAEPADTVSVDRGTYDESVTIDKPLTLHGPNGNAEANEPQAVVDGGSGTGIKIESDGVRIEAITATAAATGTAIQTSGAHVDQLHVQLNIISGGSSGVNLEASGKEDSIGFNQFEGVEDGIRLSGANYSDLRIEANRFAAPISDDAIRAASATTIEAFDLRENKFSAPVRIAAHLSRTQVHDAAIIHNSFDSTDGPQLALHGEGVTIMRNSFLGSGAAGCLQILGNQGGLVPSKDVLISQENEFVDCDPYGIQLGPEVEEIRIYGNEFPGSYDGIATSNASLWNATGQVEIHDDRLVGTTHLGVDNLVSGTLDAEQNWWGCNGGPGTPGCDGVSGGVFAGNNLKLSAPIGPRKPETGIVELPTGSSISLNPGEQAEVSALLVATGSDVLTGVPSEHSPIHFASSLGTLFPTTSHFHNGWTTVLFTAGSTPGEGFIVVSLDNQQTQVPVTIRGDKADGPPITNHPATVSTPSPASAPGSASPILRFASRSRLLAGSSAILGSISCADSCQLSAGKVQIVVGDHRYQGTLTPRGTMAAGSTAKLRVALTHRALLALRKRGKGRILVKVTVTNSTGGVTTKTVSVDIRA